MPRLQGTALALAATFAQRLGRGSSDIDTLEPDWTVVLKLLDRLGWPALHELPVAESRSEVEREARVLLGPRPPAVPVRELVVGGAAGPLPARLYVPEDAEPRGPLLLYLHGGGWVFGSPASLDIACRHLAQAARLRLLSSSYRLAPEARFPAAVDDALAAFEWAHRSADTLGADPARLIVAGDSAGANLATVVAREATETPIAQLLLYPITDLSREHPSYDEFPDGPVLDASGMRWFRGNYLGRDEEAFDPRVSPLLASNLGNMPPAYIAIASHDPLRDEGLAYSERLRAAGVPVTVALHRRQPHAFADFAGVIPTARSALLHAARWLRGVPLH